LDRVKTTEKEKVCPYPLSRKKATYLDVVQEGGKEEGFFAPRKLTNVACSRLEGKKGGGRSPTAAVPEKKGERLSSTNKKEPFAGKRRRKRGRSKATGEGRTMLVSDEKKRDCHRYFAQAASALKKKGEAWKKLRVPPFREGKGNSKGRRKAQKKGKELLRPKFRGTGRSTGGGEKGDLQKTQG